MALIHHNGLRINAVAPEDDDQMAVLHDQGWRAGPHKDTDPDARLVDVPGVLDAVDAVDDVEAEPEQPTKATKATSKEK